MRIVQRAEGPASIQMMYRSATEDGHDDNDEDDEDREHQHRQCDGHTSPHEKGYDGAGWPDTTRTTPRSAPAASAAVLTQPKKVVMAG